MRKILTLGAIAAAIMTAGAASGTAATITLIKGDQLEKISTVRKSRTPHVLRGKVSSETLNETIGPTRPSGLQVIPTGGDTLWLRDASTGQIVACWVRSSGMVGQDVIRCTENRS